MDNERETPGALEGIRVIDMTSTVMGPFATQTLGDHGADVIKVESVAGDTTRHVTPARSEAMGYTFLQLNRNKRSVVLNLKIDEHMEALHRLLKTADVFIYSVRPDAMARLKLDQEALKHLNERLISISLVGFGSEGPYSGRPAYEDLIQGLTAIPSLLAQTGSGEPIYVPVAYNDRGMGLFAVNAVLAALFFRERSGVGQHIELPMFESMATFVLGDHIGGFAFHPPIGPPGYRRILTPERRPYKTKDGYICVIIYTDDQWRRFSRLIGCPELLDTDRRFKNFQSRTEYAEEVYALVREALPNRTTAEWLEVMTENDLPASPLHTLESIFEDPHLNATGVLELTDHPSEGKLLTVKGPSNWEHTPPRQRLPAPRLGQHTLEVLEELGYSSQEARTIADCSSGSFGAIT